jgi:glycosyltransferase involved in cell wall biosynthesis
MAKRAIGGCVRMLWRHLPVQLRRAAVHSAIGLLRPNVPRVSRDVVTDRSVPRIVVGLLSSASGLGQSARLAAASLRSQGYRVLGVDIGDLFYEPSGIVTHGLPEGLSHRGSGHAIIVINGPFMPYVLTVLGRDFLEEKWITGYWVWELARLPCNWVRGFTCLHEIAVPSGFVADAVRAAGTGTPIKVAPHPVACDPLPASPFVRDVSRPEGPFTVVTVANIGSSFARKNPVALIQAYRLAFGDDRGCRLRMRLIGSEDYPQHRRTITEAVGDSETIEIEWRSGSRADLYAWWRIPDVYAALHRSEGFGLPIAEAMFAGYPVVATGWSGNMEFMNDEGAFPVRWRLTLVDDPDAKYTSADGACWAEPDIEHAATLLQRLRREPDLVRTMGGKARSTVSEQLSAAGFVRNLIDADTAHTVAFRGGSEAVIPPRTAERSR